MPWFEEEVRSAVQKASTGGEATALHSLTKLSLLKKRRERTGQEQKRGEKRREEKGKRRKKREYEKSKERKRKEKKRKVSLAHSYPWF